MFRLSGFIFLTVFAVAASAMSDRDFPSTLGGFKLSGSHDYETQNPGFGFAVAYTVPGATGSIYLYDRGLEQIPEHVRNELFTQELQIAMREVSATAERNAYKDFTVQRQGDIGSIGVYQCVSAVFSYMYQGLPQVSWTCVMPYEGDILKVRFTFQPGLPNQRELLSGFMNHLGQFLFLHTLGADAKKNPAQTIELTKDCMSGYLSAAVRYRRENQVPEYDIREFQQQLRPSLLSYCGCASEKFASDEKNADPQVEAIKRAVMWLLYSDVCVATGKMAEELGS